MPARSAALLGPLRTCLVLAVLLATATSQSYFATTYTESDGLPHQSILNIKQTADGLLWFATAEGLATYDGHSFEPAPLKREHPTLTIRYQIATDAQGRLWAFETAPPYKGWLRTDQTWQHLPHNTAVDANRRPSNLNTVFVGERNGEHFALLGCAGGELWLLSPAGWSKVPIDTEDVLNICVFDGHFVITHADGVDRMPIGPATKLTPLTDTPLESPLATAFDPSRNSCWVIGRTWIGEYRNGQFELVMPSMPDPFFPKVISIAILPDEHGGIYFGERAGCLHFTPTDGLERFERTNALDDIGLTSMMRDREGIIWAGGVRGAAKFAGRSMVNRSSKQGLPEDEVSAILQLRDGRMVLGHDMSITVLEDPVRTATLGEAAAFTRIMSMVQAKDGSIIAAASRAGLLRIDPDTLAIEQIPAPPNPTSSSEKQTVQSVSQHENGDILAAGWQRAWWLRGDETELIDVSSVPKDNSYIRQIIPDGDDFLIASRNVGIVLLGNGKMRHWTAPTQAMRNMTCVSRRPDGAIWAGSAAGLLETVADGSLRHHDFNGEHITRAVYSITDDHDGRTWFGTSDGVVIWDGKKLRDITSDKGLAGRESNRGANFCDADGRIWVGFDRGLTTFYPDREVAPRHGPTVTFLQPQVDGLDADGDSWQQLKNHQSLTFRLRSISTRDEDRLLHEYQLEGLDDTWSKKRMLPTQQVLYHSLPAGRYRLRVRVTDSAGMSHSNVSPWVEVMLPWWRTWWFTISAMAAAIALIGSITLYTTQRRNTRLLKRTVAERTANLTTERNRLRAMLTSIADGVIGVDKDNIIRVWNPTATKLTGWAESDAIDKQLDELLPPFSTPNTRPGQPVEVGTASGAKRWFEFTIAAVTSDADSGHVIAFRDVTNRRQQERLLTRTERLESLGILAGGIAHDFNNLLTVMLGNLSLLELDDELPEDASQESEQLHEQIRDAVLRARDLTQQLLTFSKGGAPVRKLGSLAKVVIESTQLALSGANVRSETCINKDLFEVELDYGQISQVIHNLVLNARQAMPHGGTVNVRGYNTDCAPQGTKGDYAVIEIRDTGTGIPPGELEHIFDPYYSTKPEGTGLGLATSHSIIKRHDGFLTADSQLGRGTVLRIHLPSARHKTDLTTSAMQAPAKAATNGTPGNQHVLCMDDDKAIRSVMESSMQSLGHRALVVADGGAAVDAYREALRNNDPFDCVLLDLTIPGGMGGLETLARLQTLNPNVVAIATTGYSTEPVRAEFAQLGFCAMLSKPFGIQDVDDALSKASDTHSRPDTGKG